MSDFGGRESGTGRLRRGVAGTVAALSVALAAASPAAAQPGMLDGGFSGTGYVATGSAQLLGVAVQPNGEVVAAGTSGGNVFVERFTTAGKPDGSYTGPGGAARAVAIAPGGDIVIAGFTGSAMLVERLTPSLTPDSTFGSGGIATALAGSGAVANSVAVGPSGQIVAAGQVGSSQTSATLAEFSSSGTASTQTIGFGGNSSFSGVTIEPDGSIAAVGRRNPSQAVDAIIGVFDSGGGLKAAGTYDYPGAGSTAFGGVTVLDNQLIVAGQANAPDGPEAIFLRYSLGGAQDASFGSGGATALPASQNLSINPGGSVGAYGVGITGPAGEIVGAGSYEVGAAYDDAALWALTPSGAPQSGFGSSGAATELGPGPATGATTNYEACALAIAPDGAPDAGEIVTVGDTPGMPNQNPCATYESGNGFVASYTGYGPPPPPSVQPAGAKPSVTTGSATSVGETRATVDGQVNPNGLSTSYQFEYGTSTAYGSTTPSTGAGNGSSDVTATATLTGLAPGTTYHYRLVATNADGTSHGADETFTTATTGGTKPSATTGKSSHTGEVSVTVSGKLTTGGLPTTYHFEYGRSNAYGSSTTATTATSASPGVSAVLSRLRPGTTYHYRLVASNADGTAYGADRTFKTAPKLKLTLGKLSTSSISTLVAHGLKVGFGCSQHCSVSGTLIVSKATAQALKLGTRSTTIASGGGKLRRHDTGAITLKVLKADSAAIGKQHKLTVTLRLVGRPLAGGPSVTVSRTNDLGS